MRRVIISLAILALCISCRPQGTDPNDPTSEATNGNTNNTNVETPEPVAVELVFPQEEFRKTQPKPSTPSAFQSPSLQQFTLKNGIKVFLLERHQYPTVSMQLIFEGGGINDSANKVGMASLCMGQLNESTQKLDKIALQETLADLASNVGSFAGNDQQGVTMNSLSKNLDATLDLFADVLLRPGFRQEDFDRSVKRAITGIEQSKTSPQSISGRVFGSIIYGTKHSSGRILQEKHIKAISLRDCKKYVSTYLKPRDAKLFVLGDITKEQIQDKIGSRLARFTGKPKKSAKFAKRSPRKGKIFFVDVPGAAQSSIRLSHEGPKRKANDYFATTLMGSVLGGGFSSRINMNLREDKGYAYGAGGGFSYNRATGNFSVGASVRTDVTEESIQEIFKEIKRIQAEGITEAELQREIEGDVLGLPSRWSTGAQTLGTFRSLLYYGLPLDYYDGYISQLQSTNLVAVKKAANTHIKTDEFKILVVGDGATVLPELKKLLSSGEIGKGTIVILDADGNVIG